MSQHDWQRLYRVECWCFASYEGGGPWEAFTKRAKADGWLYAGEGRWVCPDCQDEPTTATTMRDRGQELGEGVR